MSKNLCEICGDEVEKPTELTCIQVVTGVTFNPNPENALKDEHDPLYLTEGEQKFHCLKCYKKRLLRNATFIYRAKVRSGLVEPKKRKAETTRRVRCESNLVRSRELAVTIYPHGELGLREPNRRTEYKIGLVDVWRLAIQIAVCRLNAKIKANRKAGLSRAEARAKARKELGL